MQRDWSRWAPLTGLVFGVILVVAVLVGRSTPDSDASAAHAVSSFVAHRTQDRVTVFLVVYAAIFGLFFGAALRSFLKARSNGDGLIALGFSGMVIFVIGAFTITGMEFAATDVPGKLSPAAEQALNVLQNDIFFALLAGAGIFLIGNGLAIVADGALPKWLGWVAVPLAVIAVTPLGWFVALFALPIWSLIAGGLMFMRGGTSAAPRTVSSPGVGG
jgi:hypothetical protein